MLQERDVTGTRCYGNTTLRERDVKKKRVIHLVSPLQIREPSGLEPREIVEAVRVVQVEETPRPRQVDRHTQPHIRAQVFYITSTLTL